GKPLRQNPTVHLQDRCCYLLPRVSRIEWYSWSLSCLNSCRKRVPRPCILSSVKVIVTPRPLPSELLPDGHDHRQRQALIWNPTGNRSRLWLPGSRLLSGSVFRCLVV